MSQVYIEYSFQIQPVQPGGEILVAQLGAIGFESFVETDKGVDAYIQKKDWNPAILEEVQLLQSVDFEITFQKKEIAQMNWNLEWEKNFEPILMDGICAVRAPFHKAFDVPYEIVIEPKMSFGTGHHETTFMMLQYLLEDTLNEASVLDMGCGTAVLAILARMRGAGAIDAVDIDPWCIENSVENCQRNNCTSINVSLGDASLLTTTKHDQRLCSTYDVVIANINRNILLKDIVSYAEVLNTKGVLYLSGFYNEDLPMLKEACNKHGLTFVNSKNKNNWVAAKFVS